MELECVDPKDPWEQFFHPATTVGKKKKRTLRTNHMLQIILSSPYVFQDFGWGHDCFVPDTLGQVDGRKMFSSFSQFFSTEI